MILLLYLKLSFGELQRSGRLRSVQDLRDSIVEGSAQRIRPNLMAVVTTRIGLVPVMWSTGTGGDFMKRIAALMVGGLVNSFLLQLTIYPAIFVLWKGRDIRVSRAEAEGR